MSLVSEAREADRAGRLEEAADLYEKAVADGQPSLPELIDLALLYWQVTDFGLSSANNLDPSFIERAGKRFPELLDQAQKAFPGSTEAFFWKKYIGWTDLGGELPSPEYCRDLLRRDPKTLVPAMHLFAQTAGKECRDEAFDLLRQCEEDPTCRCRYIISVLRGVLKRESARR